MLTRWSVALLVLVSFAGASSSIGAESPQVAALPDPPKGFTWVEVKEVKCSFLRPIDWHFQKEQSPDGYAIFVTREPIPPGGMFQTGMTVNVIMGRTDFDAVKYAKDFVSEYRRRYSGTKLEEIKRGNLTKYSSTVKVKDDQGEFPMYVAAIGNSKTNTLYLIQFESSATEWAEMWKIGNVIARKIVMPDE